MTTRRTSKSCHTPSQTPPCCQTLPACWHRRFVRLLARRYSLACAVLQTAPLPHSNWLGRANALRRNPPLEQWKGAASLEDFAIRKMRSGQQPTGSRGLRRTSMRWHPLATKPQQRKKMSDTPTPQEAAGSGLSSRALFAVVDAAFDVSKFTKDNEYPDEGTPKFFEFTDLCHKLECALRAAGYETSTKSAKCSG